MYKKYAALLLIAIMSISGCIRFGSQEEPSVKGIFKTTTEGEEWSESNLYLYSGGTAQISGVSVIDLVMDPQDHEALYLASSNDGLLYSYDGGQSWQQVKGFSNGRVNAVAVDPSDKCTLFASFTVAVYKSTDCGRSWREMYLDDRNTATITDIQVDFYNPNIVYIANTLGDVIKSSNGGVEWTVVQRFSNPITKILVDPVDSRIVYVATQSKGLYKTSDSGLRWIDLSQGFKDYSGAQEYRGLVIDPSNHSRLLWVSRYGILDSRDQGLSWEQIPLITQPNTAEITAIAIHPGDSQSLYYTTGSTFYISKNNGLNWITRRLPTTGTPSALVFDPENPALLYMGVR